MDVLMQLCQKEFLPILSKLTTAFEASEKGQRIGWYRKDNCFEFHKLLISSLVAYANALRMVRKVHDLLQDECKKENTPEVQIAIKDLEANLKVSFERLSKCCHLLWRITSSDMIRRHLKLLDETHWLYHPKVTDADSPTKVYGAISSQWAQDTVNEGVVEDDQDQTSEFRSMNEDKVDKSFLRWMQLQVAHRIGQDILMPTRSTPHSILRRVEISVVTVKYPQAPDREMESWVELLRSLCFPQDFNVQGAIDAIKTSIQAKKYNGSIFKKFRKAPDFDLKEFPGNLHCEVLLALLMKYYQDCAGQDLETIRLLAQVWFPLHSNAIHHLQCMIQNLNCSIRKLVKR